MYVILRPGQNANFPVSYYAQPLIFPRKIMRKFHYFFYNYSILCTSATPRANILSPPNSLRLVTNICIVIYNKPYIPWHLKLSCIQDGRVWANGSEICSLFHCISLFHFLDHYNIRVICCCMVYNIEHLRPLWRVYFGIVSISWVI